jgi:hypothetical protein
VGMRSSLSSPTAQLTPHAWPSPCRECRIVQRARWPLAQVNRQSTPFAPRERRSLFSLGRQIHGPASGCCASWARAWRPMWAKCVHAERKQPPAIRAPEIGSSEAQSLECHRVTNDVAAIHAPTRRARTCHSQLRPDACTEDAFSRRRCRGAERPR